MSSKRIIAVTGATGFQGGSVAKFLLEDGTFAVRALTRNPDSPAAQALAKQGAEVVKADFEHPATIDAAFAGAYGVFGNTNFWEVFEKERDQGKLLVDAAKKAGIKHFVWASLDSIVVDGGKTVPHFETKNDVYLYLKKSGVPYTNFITAFYFENFLTFAPLKKTADGYAVNFGLPADVAIASYSVRDNGGWVTAFFKNPDTWIGGELKTASQFITPTEYAKTLTEVLGKPVALNAQTQEQFLAADKNELWLNMKAFEENQAPPFRDVEKSLKVYPGALNFKAFAQKYKDELIARAAA